LYWRIPSSSFFQRKLLLGFIFILMFARPKTSYHPYLLVAFYLKCLPSDLLQHIPRSTRHEWAHKDQAALYGYNWYNENQQLFDTLREVAASKRLLRVNRSLLRIIALKKFIDLYHDRIKENTFHINDVVLNTIHKITGTISLKTTLKYLQRSYSWYCQLRMKQRCRSSVFSLCRIKYPGQLVVREINIIKAYCSDPRFLLWPLASVYHQIRRDKAAFFTISTFYKYVSSLGLKRKAARHRRKNHDIGIRAHAPLQILHADATVFRTADNRKSYIHLVQDNFSRAILGYTVAESCKAENTFENLDAVLQTYLIPSGISSCLLLTDDGPENAGPVRNLIAGSVSPAINHLIAQRDIDFSNSMIEAVNKQLKYRFLYHHPIANHAALIKYLQQAVQDYNNRPHQVLHGLTPLEVLDGKTFDKDACQQQMVLARNARLAENKKIQCCYYSF